MVIVEHRVTLSKIMSTLRMWKLFFVWKRRSMILATTKVKKNLSTKILS